MVTLVLAAGGGGDALGALLTAETLYLDQPPLIATLAWERLRVDPVPGPRGWDGFAGLGQVGGHSVEVLASSDTVPSGRSTLPRLAREAGARVFLLDPNDGAVGLGEQVRHLARALDVDHVVVLDVGGDAIAIGDEPGLLSPMADALILVAAQAASIPASLIVAGPGLDAELPASQVEKRVRQLRAKRLSAVSAPSPALARILEWHPTEATALLASAAAGIEGSVEMRRGGQPVSLSHKSARVWRFDLVAVIAESLFAEAVGPTTTLTEAEQACSALGINEIAYERAKAAQLGNIVPVLSVLLPNLVRAACQQALTRNADLITTRRLAELIELPDAQTDELRRALHAIPDAQAGWLWNLHVLAHAVA